LAVFAAYEPDFSTTIHPFSRHLICSAKENYVQPFFISGAAPKLLLCLHQLGAAAAKGSGKILATR
jgi:hypothetical protein